MHGARDIIFFYFYFFFYYCSVVVFLISFIVVAFHYSIFFLSDCSFSCSSRESDYNWDAGSVPFPRHSLYFYSDLLTHCIISLMTNLLNLTNETKLSWTYAT